MPRKNTLDRERVNQHRDLVEGSKRGDQGAQRELYSLYVDAMYNVCYRMVGNREDAEDILQESFINAFQKIDSFRFDSPFGAWLKRIVVNQCMNFFRAKAVPTAPLENYEDQIADKEEAPSEEVYDMKKIGVAIDKLPEGYRQIFNLYLIEGYDHQEISEITGVSVNTSKTQYHRARKKLYQIIKEL
jgi:RNA polymerase sigma factor (sigma-70 family)